MPGVRPVSVKRVVLAARAATRAKAPPPLSRQTAKAVSLVLLSVQVSVIWVDPAAVAVRFVGAAGGRPVGVTVA